MSSHGNAENYSTVLERESLVAIVEEALPLSLARKEPLIFSFNERIRPLLDAVDRLRHLKIAKEGIDLPTIVVVGDQSAGKSSVLESLAGISLPRGQGICTRVPLIMRLQDHSDPQPELHLQFLGKIVCTDETHIAEAISVATVEIAGPEKGISNTPLTLIVKKQGVPDLTMVDLPGITRVPVRGQPEDIYEQIARMIMEYITPEQSIILNVLSATVDFPTCESIRMSQRVDKTGRRTLAVVTKVDIAPEGLLEKITADDVNIGHGYVCVRNRIGEESCEEARIEEARLFESHPLLSKIDKSMVGIPVLAQKLVQIQATIISRWLPDIVRKIHEKLQENISELNKMPQVPSSVAEAMTAFMRIVGLSKESMRKLLLRGEFDEYPDPDEKSMHCTARLAEMLNQFSADLQKISVYNFTDDFLLKEIEVLNESKGIVLPNFLPRSAFLTILRKKVEGISGMPVAFMAKVWDYIKDVVVAVLTRHSESYPQLRNSTRRAAQNLIAKMKQKSFDHVMEIVEMEKFTDYTCSPEYMSEWSRLMSYQKEFTEVMNNYNKGSVIQIEGFGGIQVGHLRNYSNFREQAFDLKMRVTAYWKIVLRRFVDSMALHLMLTLQNLVTRDMEKEIVNELVGSQGGGLQRMLEESPSVSMKRERLTKSIKLLQESKEVVGDIMDRITAD